MNVTITIDDDLSPQLRKLSGYMPLLLDRMCEAVAHTHKERVKRNYLSGQALKVSSDSRAIGHLRDNIFYYKVGPGKYEVRPIGKYFNWAAGFETGMTVGRGVYVPPHPWQKPALRDIKGGIMDRLVNDMVRKAIKRWEDGRLHAL